MEQCLSNHLTKHLKKKQRYIYTYIYIYSYTHIYIYIFGMPLVHQAMPLGFVKTEPNLLEIFSQFGMRLFIRNIF